MKKRNWILAGAAFAAVLLWIGIASAHGGMSGMRGFGIMNHEDMEKIMEEGKYIDLAALRDKIGFKIMPWVENEQDFKLAQEMHEKMEKYHEEAGMPMHRNIGGKGFGGMAGCPKMG